MQIIFNPSIIENNYLTFVIFILAMLIMIAISVIIIYNVNRKDKGE